MERRTTSPRPNWTEIVESQGLSFHSTPAGPYWDESVFYHFTRREIDELEKASYALNDLCLQAIEVLLTQRQDQLVNRFLIPPPFVELCRRSWERDEITIYGRFDFSYDGRNPPKLLEYNADTPTSLLEAAVVQWHWMKACFPNLDQFNSIHDRLIEAWKRWRAESGIGEEVVYFTGVTTLDEDVMTASYLRDTAMQAGLRTDQFDIAQLGWNAPRRQFVDLRERPVRTCYKLYPWEWMLREPFAARLLESFDAIRWIEPPWKMILSNKAILPVLWELFPGHDNLLPAAYERLGWACVRKPIFGREGAGVTIIPDGVAEPPYTPPTKFAGPCIYQALRTLPNFNGHFPLIGSWMVNGYACGIGIREDRTAITGNLSRFVPHVFE
jgi:glutathionylspermidine synthase